MRTHPLLDMGFRYESQLNPGNWEVDSALKSNRGRVPFGRCVQYLHLTSRMMFLLTLAKTDP